MPIFKNNMDSVRQERHRLLRQKEEREANAIVTDIEDGDQNFYRILPPWSAAGLWRKECWAHALFKANMKIAGKQYVVCLKKTFDQPCALCDKVEELRKMKDPEAEFLVGEMRAKQKFYCNVLDLKKIAADKQYKVYVLPLGVKLYEKLTFLMEGGKTPEGVQSYGLGDITDVQTGRNIQVTKTKKNPKDPKQVDYDAIAHPQPSALPNAEAICNALHNLDEFIMRDCVTFEQMKAALDGNEDAAAAPPQGAASAPAPSAAPAAPGGFPALPGSAPAAAPAGLSADFMPPPGVAAPPAAAPAPAPAPAAEGFGGFPVAGAPASTAAPAAAGGKPSSALDRLKAMNAQKAAQQAPPAK